MYSIRFLLYIYIYPDILLVVLYLNNPRYIHQILNTCSYICMYVYVFFVCVYVCVCTCMYVMCCNEISCNLMYLSVLNRFFPVNFKFHIINPLGEIHQVSSPQNPSAASGPLHPGPQRSCVAGCSPSSSRCQ